MFGKKKFMPEDMRMHYNAPSFSLRRGKVFSPYTKEEMKEIQKELVDRVVIVYPGVNMLSSPREWSKLLSSSFFLILCGDKSDKYLIKLQKAVEKEIYSPLIKKISGVTVVSSSKECDEVLISILKEDKREVVTLNNTDEDLL